MTATVPPKPYVSMVVQYKALTGEKSANTDKMAAIVTKVVSDSTVDLTVFPDGAAPFYKTGAIYRANPDHALLVAGTCCFVDPRLDV